MDLQALMAQAQAMVDLAEQFRLQLARAPPESAGQEVRARRVFWRQIPARAAVLGISLSAGSVFDITVTYHVTLACSRCKPLVCCGLSIHRTTSAWHGLPIAAARLFLVLRQVMSTDLSEDLVSMGIAAPVTKETAGRKYHKELSRQVRSVFSRFFHAIGSEGSATSSRGLSCTSQLSCVCTCRWLCQEDRISSRESVILLRTQSKPSGKHNTCFRWRCAPAQLAEFLLVPLERAGGMMTLPDVFCLFNRARGTELVSPDDLLQVPQSNF